MKYTSAAPDEQLRAFPGMWSAAIKPHGQFHVIWYTRTSLAFGRARQNSDSLWSQVRKLSEMSTHSVPSVETGSESVTSLCVKLNDEASSTRSKTLTDR